ncbi:hypothetical protein L083_2609 [Actinoplanes sp. N902-109]|nr:hypothetical protein L083_2609 [Actinoplanes sp. N902-109]
MVEAEHIGYLVARRHGSVVAVRELAGHARCELSVRRSSGLHRLPACLRRYDSDGHRHSCATQNR